MNVNDYIVSNENMQIHIEIEKRDLAKGIIAELVAERKKQGLTQQEIADRTGMKASNVTRIESCRYMPTLEVLVRYSKAVGKKLQFVLMDEREGYQEGR